MSHLMLDIAFPPSAGAVVNDCKTAGADSVGLYVYNSSIPGTVRTPEYIAEVLKAGIAVLPIVVPGNAPLSASAMVVALEERGFHEGGLVLDIENGSSPPIAWISSAIAGLQAAAYSPGIYCSPSSYAVAIADSHGAWKWRAEWTFRPAEPPPGWDAWQYSDQQFVNGTRYDISTVVDSRVFTGANMAQADDILSKVQDIEGILLDPSGTHAEAWLRQFLEGLKNSSIANLQASVDKLSQPSFILDSSSLDAIATAVAKKLGKDLSNG